MNEAPIRVVLVDDHAVVRSGLAQLLGSTDDIEVVGQAGDGTEALAVVSETQPDVVVMDLQMRPSTRARWGTSSRTPTPRRSSAACGRSAAGSLL